GRLIRENANACAAAGSSEPLGSAAPASTTATSGATGHSVRIASPASSAVGRTAIRAGPTGTADDPTGGPDTTEVGCAGATHGGRLPRIAWTSNTTRIVCRTAGIHGVQGSVCRAPLPGVAAERDVAAS